MNVFGHRLYTSDFVPPLVYKLARFANRQKLSRFPPFDSVPYEIEAKWVLDIGANYGVVAQAALKSYRDCKVICFEPVKATFDCLKENLMPYNDRVVLYNQALSDKNGQSVINITSFHGANSIEQQSSFHKHFNPHVFEVSKEIIEIIRLDDAAIKFPTKSIDILKIDVEGHELYVLKGGIEFISTSVDTIIIEISLMRDASFKNQAIFEIFSLLNSYGFCLINIIDLHHSKDSNMLLVQMDCVFRHKTKLAI